MDVQRSVVEADMMIEADLILADGQLYGVVDKA